MIINNGFAYCVNLLKTLLQEDELVNTLIFARTEEKDLYKVNAYPLAHINPTDMNYIDNNVIVYTFEVGVLTIRDINKRDIPNDTKFEGNDNILDNLNITSAILNNLINKLELDDLDENVMLDGYTSATPLIYNDTNILDGWLMTITLSVPNNISIC